MPVPNELVGQWIGNLNGTLVGPLYVEFEVQQDRTVMVVRANVNGHVVALQGEVTDAPPLGLSARLAQQPEAVDAAVPGIAAHGRPAEGPQVALIFAVLVFDQVTSSFIAGRWSTDDRNGGIFRLGASHTRTGSPPDVIGDGDPLAIISRQEELPRLRLDRSDIESIIVEMKKAVPTTNDVVITTTIDGNEVIQLARDFLLRNDLPKELSFIRLRLTEVSNFAPKTVQLNVANEACNILVSASDAVWVNGAAIGFSRSMRRRYSRWSQLFQRHGLVLNSFVLIIALGVSPDLALVPRLVFLLLVIGLLAFFKWFHSSVSRVLIRPRAEQSSRRQGYWPEILTTAVGGLLTLIIGWAFSFLAAGGLASLLLQLSQWLAQ
jgi:hypothetical protein